MQKFVQRKPKQHKKSEQRGQGKSSGKKLSSFNQLQRQVGNRAIRRIMRQHAGPSKLDQGTAKQIRQERGQGQPLDARVQRALGKEMGHDFSGVKVHTSPEADQLNRKLGAKAFTTGKDVFFKEGAYNPHSTEGQKLLAHELTHVVQQSRGKVNEGHGPTVNALGDKHEREADQMAQRAVSPGAALNNTHAPLTNPMATPGFNPAALVAGNSMAMAPVQRQEEEGAQTQEEEAQTQEEEAQTQEEEAQTQEEEAQTQEEEAE